MSGNKFIIQGKDSLILRSCCQGLVHLSLGPMTARIDPQTFCEMAKDMANFAKGIEERIQLIRQQEQKRSSMGFFFSSKKTSEPDTAPAATTPTTTTTTTTSEILNNVLPWTHQ